MRVVFATDIFVAEQLPYEDECSVVISQRSFTRAIVVSATAWLLVASTGASAAQIVSENKADRLPRPHATNTTEAAPDSRSKTNVEERIDQAFAAATAPEPAPQLAQALEAAARSGRLNLSAAVPGVSNEHTASIANATPPQADDPAAPSPRPADPVASFDLLIDDQEPEDAPEEQDGNYLSALTSPEQPDDRFFETRTSEDPSNRTPLPKEPSAIPMPSPRPDEPVKPQATARTEIQPAPAAEKSGAEEAAMAASASPEVQPQGPQLPASLLPTRPPAN